MSLLRELTKPIADKIRFFLNVDDLIPPSQFDKKIDEVYEAGKQAEYDAFWDAYQNNGNQMPWGSQAFYGKWWNDVTFYPKYDIKPGGGGSNGYFFNNGVTNLRERIDGRGLKIIIPQGIYLTMFFRDSSTVELPDFDTSPSAQFAEYCQNAKSLVTIPRINLTNATNINNAFSGTTSLKNITFEGVIPISINFQHSPLSVASSKNAIKHLKNYNGTDKAGTCTVTFKASAFEELEAAGLAEEDNEWLEDKFSADKDFIEGNGWGWAELIGLLGWKLSLAV